MEEVIDMFIALYLCLLFLFLGEFSNAPSDLHGFLQLLLCPFQCVYCLFMPEVDELWKAPGIGFLLVPMVLDAVPLEDVVVGARGVQQDFGHLEALQSSLALELIIQIAGQ